MLHKGANGLIYMHWEEEAGELTTMATPKLDA